MVVKRKVTRKPAKRKSMVRKADGEWGLIELFTGKTKNRRRREGQLRKAQKRLIRVKDPIMRESLADRLGEMSRRNDQLNYQYQYRKQAKKIGTARPQQTWWSQE
jgi:hypothetical protein